MGADLPDLTETATYSYRARSLAFIALVALAVAGVVAAILLSRPDATTSSLRCQYAATVQGGVLQLTNAPTPSTASESYTRWREQHLEFYDLFSAEAEDPTLAGYFKSLSSAYYQVDELMDDARAPGLAAAGKAYARDAERIFTWETARFAAAEKQHMLFSWGLLIGLIGIVVLLHRLMLVRGFLQVEDLVHERASSIRELENELAQTRGFLHQAITGFSKELDCLERRSGNDYREGLKKLRRASKSALAYTGELVDDDAGESLPLSLEALLADVVEYIHTQTEMELAHIRYAVNSEIRSVQGDANLIGPLLSQACISVLELSGVKSISIEGTAVESEEDLVQLNFAIRPDDPLEPKAVEELNKAFDKEGKSEDFGVALIDGLVRSIGGKYYISTESGNALVIQLVCGRYDDVVSSENNSSLEGRRVFVVDTNVERLRVLVRQLSGYGVQAIPFNSQQAVLENLGTLRKFDAGMVVNRESDPPAGELMDALRKDRELEKLPVIGLYPDAQSPTAGIVWDALLTGSYSEADVVAALRFCLPDPSSGNGASANPTSPTQLTALQRARR